MPQRCGQEGGVKMKAEYVNFALWDFFFFLKNGVCSIAAAETGNKHSI